MAAPIIFVSSPLPGGGKSAVCLALLARLAALGRRALAMKPVETGCPYGQDQDLLPRDGQAYWEACGRRVPPLLLSPFRLAPALEPAAALARAGLALSLADLEEGVRAAARQADVLLVEGPGGALSPLADDGLTLDLADRLRATLLVVAPDELGAQGAVLGVLAAARERALRIGGVLLTAQSPVEDRDNTRLIRERGGVQVFDGAPHLAEQGRLTALTAHARAVELAERLLFAAAAP